MSDDRKFTVDDANKAGHFLDYANLPDDQILGECITADGTRCWTFAIGSLRYVTESFVEHAADEAGVCWACCADEDEWPNRERCRRCWLMYHAKVKHLFSRDCPPWPGDKTEAP